MLSFEVVDMRWGVRDEATDDHQTVSLCSREIDNCQRMSLGPNFVALLGDKYGFRPLSSRINSAEFRALRQSLIQLDVNTDFLDVWYKEDTNAMPPEYVLQPISSILKNFTNKNEPELQAVDQRIWQAIQDRLLELLLVGSNELVKQGRMSREDQQLRYSISVTEREIIEGCLDLNEAKSHCLIYERSILDLKNQTDECLAKLLPISTQQLSTTSTPTTPHDHNQLPSRDRKDSQSRRASLKIGDDVINLATSAAQNAEERSVERQRRLLGRYIDMRCKSNIWTIDEEAQEALNNLKSTKIETKFKSDSRNLTRFKIFWHEQDGVSPKSEEHKRYLNELTEHFYTNLTRLIKKASKNKKTFKSGLVNEVLQHSHYASYMSKSFHGRDEELDKIRDYIVLESNVCSKPMFIYGVSGSGKTSLLSQVAASAKDWILRARANELTRSDEVKWNQKPCIVMRFCGTTPNSSSMIDVLTSVCRQLQFNFYQYGPLNGSLDDNPVMSGHSNQKDSEMQLKYKPIPDDFVQLVFTFRQLIENCRHEYHKDRLFLLILDSIERLSSSDQTSVEVRYSWLTSITQLPFNVRIIVSCCSEEHSISREYQSFHFLKRHYLQTYLLDCRESLDYTWILHVKPPGIKLALEIVRNRLKEIKRTLSTQQWSLVEKCFAHCSRPLFVKLAFGEVQNWRSYSMQGDTKSLTFGAFILKNKSQLLESCMDDPLIAGLLDDTIDFSDSVDENYELKWQILCMEQEWHNYLDYKQRKRQIISSKATSEGGSNNKDDSVLIKIDALVNSNSSGEATTVTPASLCQLSNTINDAINQLFARIELQHGFILTKHSLSYLTAARNGICENELEDILSLDDIVLDDVFQYHLPPVRRIPPLLWTRIRNDLPDYLSERDADGIVINWHHSQFRNVTHSRYFGDQLQVLYVHSILSDYFLGRWADKPKPFRCTRHQIQMAAEQLDSVVQHSIRDSQNIGAGGSVSGVGNRSFTQRNSLTGSFGRVHGQRSGSIRSGSFALKGRLRGSDTNDQRLQMMQAKADRRVAHQPLYYLTSSNQATSKTGSDSKTSEFRKNEQSNGIDLLLDGSTRRRYNMRKLTELPYHLIRAGRFIDLAQVVIFNYDWLFSALDALGLQSLLADFEDAIRGLEKASEDATRLDRSAKEAVTNERLLIELKTMGLYGHDIDQYQDKDALVSMTNQVRVLYNTMRLSCSTLHSDTQMLPSQLIGRLLTIVARGSADNADQTKWLNQLIMQCDRMGSSHCSLIPIHNCLQTAEGMQLSSLEGHPFGITTMSMAADQRQLLAASNRFIIWDINTGQISRNIDPKIEGSMIYRLEMGSNGEYAVAYTSDNVILLLDVLTQQFIQFDYSKQEDSIESEEILGISLVDMVGASRFVVWTSSCWSVLQVVDHKFDGTNVMKMRKSIELVYTMRILDLVNYDSVYISSVNVFRVKLNTKDLIDLNHILFATPDNLLHLVTVEVHSPFSSTKESHINMWSSIVDGATSIGLSRDLKQLIYSDQEGSIFLRRKRRKSWSREKLLLSPIKDRFTDQGNDLSPLAIQLSTNEPVAINTDIGISYNECTNELATFESKFDSIANDDEIEASKVFEINSIETQKLKGYELSAGTEVVQLSYSSEIIVLLMKHEGLERKKILKFPKEVQNLSIKPNECQIKSVTLGHEYLVAASRRMILFYSIVHENLIRCIEEAHSGRIVQLLPVYTSQDLTISQKTRIHVTESNIEMRNLCVASCSMDKTVKIWTLSNLNKQPEEIHRLDSPIEHICISTKFPIAACLGAGQLGLFNWNTSKLIHPKLGLRGSNDANKRLGLETKILSCLFDSNGSRLCLATENSVNIYSIDNGQSKDNFNMLNLTLYHKYDLPKSGIVKGLRFIHQELRLIVLIEICIGESVISSDDARPGYEESSYSSDSDIEDEYHDHRVIMAMGLDLPDRTVTYTKEFRTPCLQYQQESSNATLRGTGELARLQKTKGENSIKNTKTFLCVPVITIDGHNLVVVEMLAFTTSVNENPIKQPSGSSHDQSICLCIYSTRDATQSRVIDLSRIEISGTSLIQVTEKREIQMQTQSQSLKITDQNATKHMTQRRAVPRVGQLNDKKYMTITRQQFTTMKSMSYRDRQSVVALMNQETGQNYLIDISTRQLLATSSLWNGKITSDGRFGLSRFFKSSSFLRISDSDARKNSTISEAESRARGDSLAHDANGSTALTHNKVGLELLEMSRLNPIRSLLTDRDLCKLSKCEVIGTGSEAHIDCGFSSPNDAYVYHHDSRLSRLLLIRLRDSKLVANYKLSVPIKTISCSQDGYSLLIGNTDGSLHSLAIVDPEDDETLTRLVQYPSRKRVIASEAKTTR